MCFILNFGTSPYDKYNSPATLNVEKKFGNEFY